jgi:hypothetical protein
VAVIRAVAREDVSGPPLVPALALPHIERAWQASKELQAALARAAAVCELAAAEGAPRDACVYLDMLAAQAKDQFESIERLHSLTVNAVRDRRKEHRNNV